MAFKRKNKLVLVEWVDSTQPVPSWHYLSSPPPLEVVECVSVGWLIGKRKGVLMLAPNLGDIQGGGTAQASGFIRIPTAAVTRLAELVEVQ